MAMHYSPWVPESPAISTAWLYQDFPPFFPWLLALTGAVHSFLSAHVLVTCMGLASLYFYYLLSKREMNNRDWIILPVLIFALSPGFLLGLQGILSEPLFLMLTLVFLLFYKPAEKYTAGYTVIAATILAAILLTRTIGIALCTAILMQVFVSGIAQKNLQYRPVLIVLLALLIYFFSMMLWGPVKDSHYLDVFIRYLTGKDLYQIGTGTKHYFSLAIQINSLL